MNNTPLSVIAIGCAAITTQAEAGIEIELDSDSAKENQLEDIMNAIIDTELRNHVFENTPSLARAFAKDGNVLDISVESILTSNAYHSSRDYSLGGYNEIKSSNTGLVPEISTVGGNSCHCHTPIETCHSNCYQNCHCHSACHGQGR